MKKIFSFFVFLFFIHTALAAPEKILHVYSWSDYIAPDTLKEFEKETGIHVIYDVYDSNEMLEAKLLSGHTGYDVVFPSDYPFFARQIEANIYQPLQHDRIPNLRNLDKELLSLLKSDPKSQYGVPYLWATVGLAYNKEKVEAILGKKAPYNSWDLILKPEYLSKLKSCGVAILDSPIEIFSLTMHYQGNDVLDLSKFDENLEKAYEQLKQIRPYVTYFHASQYMNDLSNGNVCMAVGWSGDLLQAKRQAMLAKKGNIVVVNPKEGSSIGFDMMAIPRDAAHVENAHIFINYLLRPDVIAKIVETVYFPSANKEARAFLPPSILNDPMIYPPESTIKHMFTLSLLPTNLERKMNRKWSNLKTE